MSVLSVRWNRIRDFKPTGDIWLGGAIRIGEIRWHYRAGRNSMYCLFLVNGGEQFFSRTPEAVLRKLARAVRLPVVEE